MIGLALVLPGPLCGRHCGQSLCKRRNRAIGLLYLLGKHLKFPLDLGEPLIDLAGLRHPKYSINPRHFGLLGSLMLGPVRAVSVENPLARPPERRFELSKPTVRTRLAFLPTLDGTFRHLKFCCEFLLRQSSRSSSPSYALADRFAWAWI